MLIGIAGKKRSGKDTVAKMIHKLNPDLKIGAFATKVKEVCALGCKLPIEYFYDDEKDTRQVFIHAGMNEDVAKYLIDLYKKFHRSTPTYELYQTILSDVRSSLFGVMTPRQIMQTIGTDLAHQYIDPEVWIKLTLADNMIISDARYPLERQRIKELGGILILVESDRQINDWHCSENSLQDDYDYVITNNGTLDDLQKEVEKWNLNLKLK